MPPVTGLLAAGIRHDHVDPPDAPAWDALPLIYRGRARGCLRADAHHAVVLVPGVATVEVHEGREIVVDPAPAVDDDVLRSWLHGPVAVLVAGQQGRFALHATVIERDGHTIAVAGRAGAGKSTTALAAHQTGAVFVADDVAVLGRIAGDRDSRVGVEPFGRWIHFTPETADVLGFTSETARTVRPGKLGMPGPPAGEPRPLDHLVVLEPSDHTTDVALRRVGGIDAFDLVRTNTYRVDIVERIWRERWFPWQADVAQQVAVWRLERPTRWCIDEVLDVMTTLSA